ncbi:hypothetical protein [Haloferax sulfurifontis]|nr:hypothetical protein [Haloferax sulfurifontis]
MASDELILGYPEPSPSSRLLAVVRELAGLALAVYVAARAARRGWRDGR